MKAHKRAKKASQQMSVVQAMQRIGNDTFEDVEDPPVDLMRRMVVKQPNVIFGMPQADIVLRVAAIKRDITILMHDYSWGFDTEQFFPGSTVWREEHEEFYVSLLHTNYDRIGLLRFQMTSYWGPLQELSTWQASSIFPFERFLLRTSTHAQNLQFAKELIANYPGGKRSSVSEYADVSESLHAGLASTMTP